MREFLSSRSQAAEEDLDVVRLQTVQDWDRGDVSRNYRGAGAAFAFLMEMDGGRYRGDVVEMLRDAYRGSMRPVEDHFGLSTRGLEALMERFTKECGPAGAR